MHLLYIMQFDRLLAALVLMKYQAMLCGILIIKSSNLDTSAYRLLLVFQSINICMSCEYRCLSKEMKLCVRHKHIE